MFTNKSLMLLKPTVTSNAFLLQSMQMRAFARSAPKVASAEDVSSEGAGEDAAA